MDIHLFCGDGKLLLIFYFKNTLEFWFCLNFELLEKRNWVFIPILPPSPW